MIDAKQAILVAKQQASQMSLPSGSLEEIERDDYKGHDVWSITLGFPRNVDHLPPIAQLSAIGKIDYKRFLIDAETGEFLAMKLRELANA